MKKQIVKILSIISSSVLTELTYRILTNPQIKKLREHELEFMDKTQKGKIKFGEFDIQTYKWGNPKDENFSYLRLRRSSR